MNNLKIISAEIFTIVRSDGHICTVELYLHTSGKFGYRMMNSKGVEITRIEYDDRFSAQDWYETTVSLCKIGKKNGTIKSWNIVGKSKFLRLLGIQK